MIQTPEKGKRSDLKPKPLRVLSSDPLVSVIVANYNYGRYLPEAVESVLRQTYPRFELIICDDGSVDESRAVLQKLAQSDPRITALYKENGGQASAWNLAYEHAGGEIISLFDPDDLFLPEKLAKVVEVFRAAPDTGLVYHQFQPVTADIRPVGMPFPRDMESGWLADAALCRGGWGPGTITSVLSFRRELAELVFPVPEEFRRGFGDAYIQAVSQFLVKIKGIPDALTYYRIHGANDSGTMQPSPAGLEVMAAARHNTFIHIRSYLAAACSEGIAEQLRLEDISSYWEYLSALYIISGKPTDGVQGYSPRILLQHLQDTPRKQIWRGLFLLPPQLSRRFFLSWWGRSWWKRYTRPVTSLLRLG
jgi:glycosyltransferase involved in cell wall biosynthesis